MKYRNWMVAAALPLMLMGCTSGVGTDGRGPIGGKDDHPASEETCEASCGDQSAHGNCFFDAGFVDISSFTISVDTTSDFCSSANGLDSIKPSPVRQ